MDLLVIPACLTIGQTAVGHIAGIISLKRLCFISSPLPNGQTDSSRKICLNVPSVHIACLACIMNAYVFFLAQVNDYQYRQGLCEGVKIFALIFPIIKNSGMSSTIYTDSVRSSYKTYSKVSLSQ